MDTYKKKYKEALERAKVWKEKSGMPKDKQGILDDIFPELAGSEDEQIRKELTKHLKEGVEGYMPAGDSSDYRRWLDWLEKQGKSSDQIHYWTEEEIEPIISDYLRGAEHYGGMIARLRCLKPKSLEKQAQKSAIEMKSAEESLGIDSDTYNEIVDECIYGEQKPAWSEEDEKKFVDACIMLDCYKGNNWWTAQYIKDWLKSLKDRYTWKPSDEQMADLWNMLCECRPADHQLLQDIYYGLKKLR